jgi:fibronectin type 3 domain-containing protein
LKRALRLPVAILTILFLGIVCAVLFRVTADEKPHSVLLKWNPPLNKPGVSVTGYKVYRSGPDGIYTSIAATVVPTFTDTKVVHGTYYYYVKAVNAGGEESPASNNAAVEVP